MALLTRTFASATNADQTCTFDVTYDDVSRFVQTLTCTNGLPGTAYAEVRRSTDGRVYGANFPPGTRVFNVPQNGANRILIDEVSETTFIPRKV